MPDMWMDDEFMMDLAASVGFNKALFYLSAFAALVTTATQFVEVQWFVLPLLFALFSLIGLYRLVRTAKKAQRKKSELGQQAG